MRFALIPIHILFAVSSGTLIIIFLCTEVDQRQRHHCVDTSRTTSVVSSSHRIIGKLLVRHHLLVEKQTN